MSLAWLHAKGSSKRAKSEAPWREVIWIETQHGDRGGQTWALILACGHMAFRPMRTGKHLDSARLVFMDPRRGLAPKRCRCDSCAAGIPPLDPGPLIELRAREGSESD
jgi:hypothetical protein